MMLSLLKTCGPNGQHHPPSIPLPCVCIIPNASIILKCMLEVVLFDGVQQGLRLCLEGLIVKVAFLHFHLQ
jgi:hypothetical protein